MLARPRRFSGQGGGVAELTGCMAYRLIHAAPLLPCRSCARRLNHNGPARLFRKYREASLNFR